MRPGIVSNTLGGSIAPGLRLWQPVAEIVRAASPAIAEADMNGIEKTTLADGFRICLLGVYADRRSNVLQHCAILYDGGKEAGRSDGRIPFFLPDASPLDALRSLLLKVAAPPRVLVAYGRGWRELICQCMPASELPRMRVLDLYAAAAALRRHASAPLPKARATPADLAGAYQLALKDDGDPLLPAFHEELLWVLISAADKAGLDWDGLLGLPGRMRPAPVDYRRYSFDEATLATLPASPAVYMMRRADGATLYVGKARDLRRRIGDYFRPAADIPPKLRAIRDGTRDIGYRLVGSELEALLLEQRMIGELEPTVNVQRRVAEGSSRYAAPLVPVVVVCPSARKGMVELFFFGGGRAVQRRLDLRRPPVKALAALVRHFAGEPGATQPGGRAVDWGAGGNEVCCRYFARFRSELQWLDLGDAARSPDPAGLLARVARVAAGSGLPPGEFRELAG